MKFFKQNSRDEYNEQVRQHTAEENERAEQQRERDDAAEQRRTENAKEAVRKRQQKHRQKTYSAEIANGTRSPGGTKQKRKVSNLFADSDCIVLVTYCIIIARHS